MMLQVRGQRSEVTHPSAQMGSIDPIKTYEIIFFFKTFRQDTIKTVFFEKQIIFGFYGS